MKRLPQSNPKSHTLLCYYRIYSVAHNIEKTTVKDHTFAHIAIVSPLILSSTLALLCEKKKAEERGAGQRKELSNAGVRIAAWKLPNAIFLEPDSHVFCKLDEKYSRNNDHYSYNKNASSSAPVRRWTFLEYVVYIHHFGF